MTVSSQTSPPKGTQRQNYVVTKEQPSGNQIGNEPVSFLSCSKNCPTDIQNTEQHVTTTPPLTSATPLIEEALVRDEQTNKVHISLTSAIFRKQKQVMLCVPLDFESNLTVDALVDSGAFVSAFAQSDVDTKKKKKPQTMFSKSTILPIFKYK